jgi:hypothetical protein
MKTKSWTITYDPLSLLDEKNTSEQLEDAARDQGEDIIQCTSGSTIIDLGWYYDRYRMFVVENENWTTPIRQFETFDLTSALKAFRESLI